MNPIPTIAFFNNKGGVGKTSLVYHLAWMYADMNVRVVAADLDPQSNLTAAFLPSEQLEQLWLGNDQSPNTMFRCIEPLKRGVGDVSDPILLQVEPPTLFEESPLALLAGDLQLSSFEDQLSEVWPKCLDGDERAFRVMSAFWRVLQAGAKRHEASLILLDLGPNLGAINRAALIAADYVVVPLAPDLFSLQGLRNLGPTLREWRTQWQERVVKKPVASLTLPKGQMEPLGYVVLQHDERLNRPVRAFERWVERIPKVYHEQVLGEKEVTTAVDSLSTDPHHLGLLKNYRSLVPMAQEANKPLFHLKPADGAIGSHSHAVQSAARAFRELAIEIARRVAVREQRADLLQLEQVEPFWG